MNPSQKNKIINALIDQKNIFGDNLYVPEIQVVKENDPGYPGGLKKLRILLN
jgi:hypothetical protein